MSHRRRATSRQSEPREEYNVRMSVYDQLEQLAKAHASAQKSVQMFQENFGKLKESRATESKKASLASTIESNLNESFTSTTEMQE